MPKFVDVLRTISVSDRFADKKAVADTVQECIDDSQQFKEIARGGKVVIFVFHEKDKFSPMAKIVEAIAKMDMVYNTRAIMRNAEIGVELAEVYKSLKEAEKRIRKRLEERFSAISKARKRKGEEGAED
jgi:uncharacterized protein YqgV (UPF0045/DUF77 family)